MALAEDSAYSAASLKLKDKYDTASRFFLLTLVFRKDAGWHCLQFIPFWPHTQRHQSGNLAGNSSHLERNHLPRDDVHGMMFRYRQRMAERQRCKTTAILKWSIAVLPVEGESFWLSKSNTAEWVPHRHITHANYSTWKVDGLLPYHLGLWSYFTVPMRFLYADCIFWYRAMPWHHLFQLNPPADMHHQKCFTGIQSVTKFNLCTKLSVKVSRKLGLRPPQEPW